MKKENIAYDKNSNVIETFSISTKYALTCPAASLPLLTSKSPSPKFQRNVASQERNLQNKKYVSTIKSLSPTLAGVSTSTRRKSTLHKKVSRITQYAYLPNTRDHNFFPRVP